MHTDIDALKNNNGPLIFSQFQKEFDRPPTKDPPTLSEEQLLLIETIRKAFQGVELEDGIGLMQAEAMDGYASDPVLDYLALHDEKRDWTTFTANHLNACSCALSFADAKGFRFLIPAFVIHDIMDLLGTADPYFHLTYSPRPDPSFFSSFPSYDEKQFLSEKCALLTTRQKSALQQYIRYCRTSDPSWRASLWDMPEEKEQIEDREKIEAAAFSKDVPSAANWISSCRIYSHATGEHQVYAVDKEEKEWLLRIFPSLFYLLEESDIQEKINRKQQEISLTRELARAGLPVSAPVESGPYGNRGAIYILEPWTAGIRLHAMEESALRFESEQYYHWGRKAGAILQSIHSVPIPFDDSNSGDLSRTDIEDKLNQTDSGVVPPGINKKALRFVQDTYRKITFPDPVLLHGNFTSETLIYKDDRLIVTNFNSWGTGDPARDFCPLFVHWAMLSRNWGICFARGVIDGYCDSKPTEEFFRRIAFHLAFDLCFNPQHDPTGAIDPSWTQWLDATWKGWKSPVPTWYQAR